jgi:Ricin-type beta-trefoil lectin domain-like/Secretion system C-terminal sorting domain
VYSNLESGTYKVKIKLNDCEIEDEKVVLNDPNFNFDPTKCYKIVNKNSGKVLDVFQNKTSNNIPIIQYALNGGGNQKWQFSYTTGGYLKLKVQSSGKYLACHDNYNGANAYQYDYYSGGQKDWAIECVGNGDFRIVHRYSGKYLSVENNSKVDAAKVEIRHWMNSDAQKWQIVEVPCGISANLSQAGYMTAKAEAEVKQINITWYSNMGYKTDYYTVEKFNEQKEQFEEISTLNNTQYSDELHYFTYSDMSPLEGDNAYRIKAVFNDGTTQLSPSLKVAFGDINAVRLFPNPAVDYIDILLNDAPKNEVTLRLNNVLGLPVIQKSYQNEQRMHFEIKDISNGIYQLHISQKGKRDIVKQVVIQK